MTTFAQSLTPRPDSAAFAQALAGAEAAVRRDHRLHANEVEPAARLIAALARGARTNLLAYPMQSGKTNIMRATGHILRLLNPAIRAIHICANDQLDLRRQNKPPLAPVMDVLTRSGRKKSPTMTIVAPTVVFYDESHFGDGAGMTIEDYLLRQGIFDHPLAVFVGVSATPMSSFGCLDATIQADMRALEAVGYNSPGVMLARGRVRDSEPLFAKPSRTELAGRLLAPEDITILEDNPAYRHLEALLDAPEREGFVLIRCHRMEAEVLAEHLKGRWGDHVFIEHWNQHNREFDAERFFSQRRWGVITVVLVQHKARMGTIIPTEDCHFMYEPASRRASVDTIAQSFLGRASGFKKADHKTIVYTRAAVAEAYTRLMAHPGDAGPFSAFCQANKLKPSSRARLVSRTAAFALEHCQAFPARAKDSMDAIRAKCRGIAKAFDLERGRGHVRTLSRNEDPVRAGLIDPSGRPRPIKVQTLCGRAPGDWTMIIYDRVWGARGRRAAGEAKGIILAIRGGRMTVGQGGLEPTEASFHHSLREMRRERGQAGQMAFGFGSGLVASPPPMAAAGR